MLYRWLCWLTESKQYGYQYAQAAFSHHLILLSQVTESRQKQRLTQMTLIVDVDMNLLKELHEHGSVNTMRKTRRFI
jgi:hypothetical protein